MTTIREVAEAIEQDAPAENLNVDAIGDVPTLQPAIPDAVLRGVVDGSVIVNGHADGDTLVVTAIPPLATAKGDDSPSVIGTDSAPMPEVLYGYVVTRPLTEQERFELARLQNHIGAAPTNFQYRTEFDALVTQLGLVPVAP